MKVYIARMSEEWSPDFLIATADLATMVNLLNEEVFKEEYIFTIDEKEMVKSCEEREKSGYVNLLDIEGTEIPEDWGLSIEVRPLHGYKK